ncbi:MAG: Smr/MutS family protein [Gemmatimonadales bacterium]|nr:Smr/MutS family protein [Gemmatimonadales bacterium]
MINLLERIRIRESEATVVLGPRAGMLLEWPAVKRQISNNCLNGRAVEHIQARQPFTSLDRIRLEHDLADELRPAAQENLWPPLIDLTPALELLEQQAPVRLEGPDLVHLAGVAEELDALRDYFLGDRPAFPLWGDAAIQMSTFGGLTGAIRRALDGDGRLKDDASPLLGRLRRSALDQERLVRQETNRAMGDARAKGWVTADEVTLRGDRFCLPLRAGDVRRVSGIIHDRSTTGATLFLEPAGVVRLANQLTETRLGVAAEEARILFELNRAAEEAAPAVKEAAELMLLADGVRAHLLWSRALRCNRPELDEGGQLRVCGGRHPLLIEALGGGDHVSGREKVIPLDLELAPEARALVISGPNAGGKSVAMKSVGVFCLLAQCGWDIPAREDTRLPFLNRLLVDLGDDQSIAESLSSFSAHLGHLGRFLAEAKEGTLVLCDEIGSGTDPQEGTALAFCVLGELADSGARILASTHFGLLKAAVHDHPRMVNAAMDYDERDLRPMFTVRVGDPGTSHAFDIAARLGFPGPLLERARSMVGQERVQIEKLLVDLDRRARELASSQEELQQALLTQEEGGRELKQRLRGWKKERRELEERFRRKGDDLLRESRKRIEQVVREIRSSDAKPDVVRSARNQLGELDRKLSQHFEGESRESSSPVIFEPGQRVRIPHLGLTGLIVEVRGDRLVAIAQGMRLTLGRDAVRGLDEEGTNGQPSQGNQTAQDSGERPGVSWTWQGEAPKAEHQIDLRGETGEDAWQRLDVLIDRAIPAGLEIISVIHGHGTGRLKDHLHGRLKADPRVSSFQESGPGRGGGGVTEVTLANS